MPQNYTVLYALKYKEIMQLLPALGDQWEYHCGKH